MTRGYAVLAEGEKVLLATYYNSDAYPDGYGMAFLQNVCAGNAASYITERNAEDPDKYAVTDMETVSAFVKTKKNADDIFVDYTYIFDKKSGQLDVVYYGKKVFTVSLPRDAALVEYLFTHWDFVRMAYGYDEMRMSRIHDVNARLRQDLKAGVPLEYLRSYVESSLPSVELFEAYHMGHNNWGVSCNIYYDFDFDECSHQTAPLTFKVFPVRPWMENSKFSISVQLPHLNVDCVKGAFSKAGCVCKIQDFVAEHKEDLVRMAPILTYYQDVERSLARHESKDITEADLESCSKSVDAATAKLREMFECAGPIKFPYFTEKHLVSALRTRYEGMYKRWYAKTKSTTD